MKRYALFVSILVVVLAVAALQTLLDGAGDGAGDIGPAGASGTRADAPVTPLTDEETALDGPVPAVGPGVAERVDAAPEPEREPSVPGVEGDGIAVRLEDPDGEPLADQPVVVRWRRGFGNYGEDVGRTGADGRFRSTVAELHQLEDIDLGEPDDDDPLGHPGPFVLSGDDEIVIRLPRMGKIAGRVRDLDGAPISGVPVLIEREPTLALDPRLHVVGIYQRSVPSLPTEGRFAVAVPLGHYTLEAKSDEHPSMYALRVHLTPERPDVDVFLRVGTGERELEVVIEEPKSFTDGPRVSAWTKHRPRGIEREVPAGASILTRQRQRDGAYAGEGTWRIRGLDDAPWQLSVSARGYESYSAAIPPTAERVVVRLARNEEEAEVGVLAGRLYDSTGSPTRGEFLILRPDDLGRSARGSTDRDGRFSHRFATDRSGEFFLVVKADGHAWLGAGPFPKSAPPGDLELRLEAGGTLTGEVVDGRGSPVDCTVLLYRPASLLDPAAPSDAYLHHVLEGGRTVTGERGRFDFDGVGPGGAEVWVHPVDASLPPARAVGRGGDHLRVVLGTGLEGLAAVHGRVLDRLTGLPVEGAEIEVRRGDDDGGHGGGSGRSAPDGTYSLLGHAAGDATIHVHRLGFADLFVEAKLESGDNALDLELSPARLLHLRVVDARGEPVAGARLAAFDGSGRRLDFQDHYGNYDGRTLFSDLDGRADLRGLPAGVVSIVVGIEDPDEHSIANLPEGVRDAEQPEAEEYELDLTDPVPELVELQLLR